MAATVGFATPAYSLRIEYALDPFVDLPISERDTLPNWFRDFRVSGKTTLEQLSEIILAILGWNSLHLYEFRIHNQVYAHLVFLSEDDLFVDAQNRCVLRGGNAKSRGRERKEQENLAALKISARDRVRTGRRASMAPGRNTVRLTVSCAGVC